LSEGKQQHNQQNLAQHKTQNYKARNVEEEAVGLFSPVFTSYNTLIPNRIFSVESKYFSKIC